MKIVSVFLMCALLSSCTPTRPQSTEKKDVSFEIKNREIIRTCEPLTQSRFDCSGKKLKNPQLVGMKEAADTVIQNQTITISEDSLAKLGFIPTPRAGKDASIIRERDTATSFSSFWSTIGDALQWLTGSFLGILLLAGVAISGFFLLGKLLDIAEKVVFRRKSEKGSREQETKGDTATKTEEQPANHWAPIVAELTKNGGRIRHTNGKDNLEIEVFPPTGQPSPDQ